MTAQSSGSTAADSTLSDKGEATQQASGWVVELFSWFPKDLLDFMPGAFLYVGPTEIALRLGVALLAGFLLGIDREIRGRPAGVRTYMLVSVGAAVYSLITMELVMEMAEAGSKTDPTRITQGLIGGIGFLGAGAIIQSQGRVGGLATAASIWVAGAVGMASGLGYYSHAFLLACVTTFILFLSRFIEGRGGKHQPGGHQARTDDQEKQSEDDAEASSRQS